NTFLDMWITNGGNNQTGFSSPLYDRLLRTAADVTPFIAAPEPLLSELPRADELRNAAMAARPPQDQTEALALQAKTRMLVLREAEALLVDDELPIMPLYFYVVSGLVRPRVHDFYAQLLFPDGTRTPNLQDIHPLRDLSVDERRGA